MLASTEIVPSGKRKESTHGRSLGSSLDVTKIKSDLQFEFGNLDQFESVETMSSLLKSLSQVKIDNSKTLATEITNVPFKSEIKKCDTHKSNIKQRKNETKAPTQKVGPASRKICSLPKKRRVTTRKLEGIVSDDELEPDSSSESDS